MTEGITSLASVRASRASTLREQDIRLITLWAASQAADGQAPSSIDRAKHRVEAFARGLARGLLMASKREVVCFYQRREQTYLARYREIRKRNPGPPPFWRTPTWAILARTLKAFYRWAEEKIFISPEANPTRGLRVHPLAATNAPLNTNH